MARLILEYNQEVLEDFPLRNESITIGRHWNNIIVLDDPEVSSFHARIDKSGTSYIVTDLQSTNGIFVNNRPVISGKLIHGDRIRIGKHDLLFVGTEKAKMEEEDMNIALDRTVMIGVSPKLDEAFQGKEARPVEPGPQKETDSRPNGRLFPVLLVIFFVFLLGAGGWFITKQGPDPIKGVSGRIRAIERGGDGVTNSDAEPPRIRSNGTGLSAPASSAERKSSDRPGIDPTDEDQRLVAEEKEKVPFVLDGIAWSSEMKQSFAVINGIIVRVRDSIDGATVTEIDRNYVTLLSPDGDSEFKLVLR